MRSLSKFFSGQRWTSLTFLIFVFILVISLLPGANSDLALANDSAPQDFTVRDYLFGIDPEGETANSGAAQNPSIFIMPTANPYPTPSVPLSNGFDYPVGGLNHEGFNVINCFGCGVDWLGDYGHTAEDYENGREGDPVYAVSNGIVLWRGVGPNAYGNVLIVQHNVQGTAIYTLYAHLRDLHVVPGQIVGRRQQIATVGQSGSFMPHLHFEVRTMPHIADRGYTFYPFSGTSIDAYGMTFYAPSWYIETHRHLNSPFGRVDNAKRVPGGFQLSGWALDPDTPAFIAVHVYLDGQLASIVAASEERPDVGNTFPGRGTAHGFRANVGAAAGTHKACAYGINAGPGDNSLIGCRTYTVSGDPFGSLEGASMNANGQLQMSGWAIDPDTALPIDVHVYVNGKLSAITSAEGDREDIETAYPEYGGEHGFSALVPMLAAENTVCAYGFNTEAGDNTLLGCKPVHGNWDAFPSSPLPNGRRYYWPWYDSAGETKNWVLMASPPGGATLNFDLNIGGKSPGLSHFGGPGVAAGSTLFASYGGLVRGPVVATSLTGDQALVSQRILWKGKSLEEVPGTGEERLSSHFWWTWYDQQTPGMADWVMVANPNDTSVYYEITVGGEDPGGGSKGTVAPGQSVWPAFPGLIGGPVEVRTWTDETKAQEAKVMASQRVLSRDGQAFNEMPGIPAEELSDHYIWTWYDSVGHGRQDWLMLANPGNDPLYYEITIAGEDPGDGSKGWIEPGKYAFPTFAGKSGGPVEVKAFTDEGKGTPAELIASQRILWGLSFGETPGYPYEDLASEYHWTWYDQSSPGSQNWVMVSNPSDQLLYFEVTMGGGDPDPTGDREHGTIEPGESAFPAFPGIIGGPVQVKAWHLNPDGSPDMSAPADFMASQRVLWNGYFNEVQGTVLD